MFAIFILIAFSGFNNLGSNTFERIDSIVLDFDWAEGVNSMAIMNGHVYLTRPLSYEIYVVDLGRKQNVQRLGGQGNGPGEFDAFIGNVFKLNDGIAVTSAKWIQFFDHNGKFQNRVFLKTTSITSIRSFQGGQYLVGTRSSINGENLNDIANVGIMRSRTTDTFDFEMFGNQNKIENMNLNNHVLDSDEKYVVIGQYGSNEIRFYNHDGTVHRKITLAGNPNEITFRERPNSEEFNRISEQFGIKLDFRLPSFSIVSAIALTPKLTIIQGLFDQNGSKKSHAVISHSDWSVDYVNIGTSCRSMAVENELMYCLKSPLNKTPQIDIYRIKS